MYHSVQTNGRMVLAIREAFKAKFVEGLTSFLKAPKDQSPKAQRCYGFACPTIASRGVRPLAYAPSGSSE